MKSQYLATTGRAHIKAPMDRQANRVFLDANSALLQPNPSGIPLDRRLAGSRDIHLPAGRVCAHGVEDSRAMGSRAHRGTLRPPHPWLTYQISKRRGWTPSPETRAGCSDRERSTQDPRSATVSRAHSLIHAVPDRTCMCLRARGMRRSSPRKQGNAEHRPRRGRGNSARRALEDQADISAAHGSCLLSSVSPCFRLDVRRFLV